MYNTAKTTVCLSKTGFTVSRSLYKRDNIYYIVTAAFRVAPHTDPPDTKGMRILAVVHLWNKAPNPSSLTSKLVKKFAA